MLRFFQRRHAVVAQPAGPAPNDDVAVREGHAQRSLVALQSTEQEHRRHAERHRDDRLREVPLVFVLMQRQPRAGLVAIDEAGIGRETGEARSRRRVAREPEHHRRDRRPRRAGDGIGAGIAIAALRSTPSRRRRNSSWRPTCETRPA